MTKPFCVNFDTKTMPGTVVATVVTLTKWVMRGKDTARLDLCEHPLYPHLVQYVKSNPYRPPTD